MIIQFRKLLSGVVLAVTVLAVLMITPSTAVAEERETASGYYDHGRFGVTVSYPKQANPGGTVDIAVELRTDRELDFIINVNLYRPGAGWSDWVEYFRGRLTPYSTIHRSKSFSIPLHVKTGYIVIWVSVQFLSSRDYQKIDGKDYYARYDWVIAGPYVVSRADMLEWCGELGEMYLSLLADYIMLDLNYSMLESNYTILKMDYDILKMNYDTLKEDYDTLKKRFSELKESYNTLKESYDALQDEHRILKSWYEHLKARYEALSAEYESVKSELAAKTSTVNTLKAATIALTIALAASLTVLVLKVRRPAPERAGLPSAQANTRSTVAPPL
ncbi:MAG: hypothetical protein QXE66_06430 [Desulfurococcaceae archaeon]